MYRNPDSHNNKYIYAYSNTDNYINGNGLIYTHFDRHTYNHRNCQHDIKRYYDLNPDALFYRNGFADSNPKLNYYRLLHNHTHTDTHFYLHHNSVFHDYHDHAAYPNRHVHQNKFLF